MRSRSRILPIVRELGGKSYDPTVRAVRVTDFHDLYFPRQFVESLIRSSLTNRTEYSKYTKIFEINVEDTNIFDFSMSYEEKVRLYNIGYSTIK